MHRRIRASYDCWFAAPAILPVLRRRAQIQRINHDYLPHIHCSIPRIYCFSRSLLRPKNIQRNNTEHHANGMSSVFKSAIYVKKIQAGGPILGSTDRSRVDPVRRCIS